MLNSKYFKEVVRPYTLELTGSIVAYGVLLVLSLLVLRSMSQASPWRAPVALIPMLGALGVLLAVVRVYHRLDEFERLQLLESVGVSFAGTALITFGYGFLENIGFPHVSWFFVWVIMGALWLAAKLISRWRYR